MPTSERELPLESLPTLGDDTGDGGCAWKSGTLDADGLALTMSILTTPIMLMPSNADALPGVYAMSCSFVRIALEPEIGENIYISMRIEVVFTKSDISRTLTCSTVLNVSLKASWSSPLISPVTVAMKTTVTF